MAFSTKTFVTAVALGAILLATPAVRAADDLIDPKSIPGSFSANIWGVSEYFFRGISQTDDKPALQGGFDYTVDLLKGPGIGGYLGVWGSNVDFNETATTNGANLEIDLYGGLRGKLFNTGIGWDVGFIYYYYPGTADALGYDFVEGKIALSYDFGIAAVTASYNYSPDYFADSGNAHYPKFQVDVPVGKYLTLSAYIARQYVEKNVNFALPDYTEWNVKAATKLAGFDLFVMYTDTNIQNVDAAADMVLFGIGRSF